MKPARSCAMLLTLSKISPSWLVYRCGMSADGCTVLPWATGRVTKNKLNAITNFPHMGKLLPANLVKLFFYVGVYPVLIAAPGAKHASPEKQYGSENRY